MTRNDGRAATRRRGKQKGRDDRNLNGGRLRHFEGGLAESVPSASEFASATCVRLRKMDRGREGRREKPCGKTYEMAL